eukprot:1686381-Lingulodinium_polyedra.AAC.1
MRAPVLWRAHGVRKRASCEPLQRRVVDSIAPLCSVLRMLRNGAVESTVRHRSGSRLARLRAPCALEN